MYITTNYLGIGKGAVKYLFFLLSEDYIESNKLITAALRPLQDKFAKDLRGSGAIVRPTEGDASENTEKVLNKKLFGRGQTDYLQSIYGETPLLLCLDRAINDFNPHHDPHLLISLRKSIDEHGNVKVFELTTLFQAISDSANRGDLFECAGQIAQAQGGARSSRFFESLQLRPNLFGVGIDLKEAFKAIRRSS